MRRAHNDYAKTAIARTIRGIYLQCSNSYQLVMTRRHEIKRMIKMAAIETNRSAQFRTAPVGLSLTRFVAAFTAWNDARATRKALSVLSDRELEDIGLSRADIASFSVR